MWGAMALIIAIQCTIWHQKKQRFVPVLNYWLPKQRQHRRNKRGKSGRAGESRKWGRPQAGKSVLPPPPLQTQSITVDNTVICQTCHQRKKKSRKQNDCFCCSVCLRQFDCLICLRHRAFGTRKRRRKRRIRHRKRDSEDDGKVFVPLLCCLCHQHQQQHHRPSLVISFAWIDIEAAKYKSQKLVHPKIHTLQSTQKEWKRKRTEALKDCTLFLCAQVPSCFKTDASKKFSL